jgi:hypothetical protein
LFILSDLLKPEEFNLVYSMHTLREFFFKAIGFTQGEGVYSRTKIEWTYLLKEAGFIDIEYFEANVFLHSTFNLVCKKRVV